MTTAIIALDVSISMAKSYADIGPTKLDASIEAVAAAGKRLVMGGGRVGIVIYARWAMPLVYPTKDARLIMRGLSALTRTFEGSAPGDAIVESVRMLYGIHDPDKRIILVTDGEYNTGVPLEHAVVLALNSGIRLIVVLIGDIEEARIGEIRDKFGDSIEWHSVSSRSGLLSALMRATGVSS